MDAARKLNRSLRKDIAKIKNKKWVDTNNRPDLNCLWQEQAAAAQKELAAKKKPAAWKEHRNGAARATTYPTPRD